MRVKRNIVLRVRVKVQYASGSGVQLTTHCPHVTCTACTGSAANDPGAFKALSAAGESVKPPVQPETTELQTCIPTRGEQLLVNVNMRMVSGII